MSEPINLVNLIEAGIKANTLRQKVVANNLANLNTPGFRRHAVEFEKVLQEHLETPGKVDLSEVKAELSNPMNTPVKANGNDVNMEIEVGELMKSTGRTKAYVRLLNKHYKQIESAMNI